MTNSLPADLAEFVHHELAAGHYQSVEEIFCDSLRLLRSQKERLNQLRAELQPALEELDGGGGIIVKHDELRDFFDQIIAEVKTDLGLREPRGA